MIRYLKIKLNLNSYCQANFLLIQMFSDSLSSLSKISSVQDIDFGDISGAFCINFSFDDQYFAVGCGNGSIQV